MNLSIDVYKLTEPHADKREQWKKDFSANYEAFADKIALAIIPKYFEELKSVLSNPFTAPLQSHRFSRDYSFKIYDKETDKNMQTIFGEAGTLPPFKEWLMHVFRIIERDFDYDYFDTKMETVGRAVEKKLQEIFTEVCKKPGAGLLKFEVTWHASKDSTPNPVSCSKLLVMKIHAWL